MKELSYFFHSILTDAQVWLYVLEFTLKCNATLPYVHIVITATDFFCPGESPIVQLQYIC